MTNRLLITTNPKMTTAVLGLKNPIPQADDFSEGNLWPLGLPACHVAACSFHAALVCQGLIEKEK